MTAEPHLTTTQVFTNRTEHIILSSYLIRGWYFLFGFGGCGVAAAAAAVAVVVAAVVVAVAVSEVVAVVAMMELKTNLFVEKKIERVFEVLQKKNSADEAFLRCCF